MDDNDDLLLNAPRFANNRRRYFFKYMTYDTALAVLRNHTLRWSTSATLNDPFDMGFDLLVDVDFARVKELVLNQSWNDHFGEIPAKPGNKLGELISVVRHLSAQKGLSMSREAFANSMGPAVDETLSRVKSGVDNACSEVRTNLDRVKVLCLTTQPDNMLMWSHYAQQHSGALVRLENVVRVDSPYCMAQQVTYASEMPRWMDEQELADLLSGRGQPDQETLFCRLVLTKAHHWAYESEWRIFGGLIEAVTKDFHDREFSAVEIESVIFGCRMSDDKREALRETALQVNPHVRFWEAKPNKSAFRMDILPMA
jgi:hypothetical protein